MRKIFSCIAFLALTVAMPLGAQDRFGSAVAVLGEDLVVLKAANMRGPATVYLFSSDMAGGWQPAHRFYPENAGKTGEGFSSSLSADGTSLAVASGDPNGLYGGAVLALGPEGWSSAGRLPLMHPDSLGERELDLAGIISILQPPRRLVALDGDLAVVALRGGQGTRVAVFRRDASGTWAPEADLTPSDDDADRSFGSALAIRDGTILVGSPGEDRMGMVFVFRHSADSGWTQAARLAPEDLERGQNFGAALAFDEERVVVGSRGGRRVAGDVRTFGENTESGLWSEVARVSDPDTLLGDRFGSVLALSGDDLWVGAPADAEGAGRVYRYVRDASSGDWNLVGVVGEGLAEGDAFGSAVALQGDLAIVGAPGARGNKGLAAAYRRTDAGWSDPVWLDDGLALDMVAGNETRCEGGQAAHFTCDNVDLLAYLPIDAVGGEVNEGVSDLWGWTDPETGKEYVLLGRTGGAAFIDISSPSDPVYLGMVAANRSGARDLKVYKDHLFLTGDGAGDHGLVVFDLTRLRDVASPPMDFEPDAVYREITSAHNLILDAEAGYAYPVGASGGGQTCGGGLHMVDIRDPKNPVFAGCYTDTEGLIAPGRTHDGQCVVYRGPDEDYQGRQICFASNETALRIVDVTDKENPVPLSAVSYPGRAYIHQGWLTDDQTLFYLNDELDELVGVTDRTRTMILDVADLEDPVVVGEYRGTTSASDHNLYVKGDRMYQANYQAGLQVIDISDRENPVEIGRFDTTPYEGGDPPGFSGAWTAYPFFESGVVVVSSRAEGLFILKPRPPELVP